MAKSNKKEKSSQELLENPEELASRINNAEQFLEKNRNLVLTIGAVIAVAVAGLFFYRNYTDEQNQEAQEEMYQAIYYFESDSLDLALYGDGNSLGFLDVIDMYGLTKSAELSHFYAGAAFLKKGEYDQAIEHLEQFSTKEFLVQSRAYALLGDAHMELEQYQEAASYYEKAANHKPTKEFTPGYLMKAGLAFELSGDLENAISAYQVVVDQYPKVSEFSKARKELARLEAMAMR